MAERKSPHTEPVLDSKSDADKDSISLMLSDFEYATAIRTAKRAKFDTVNQLYKLATHNLARLKHGDKFTNADDETKAKLVKSIKPDMSKSEVYPEDIGSNQVDAQSLILWMSKVGPKNRNAHKQLVSIHATLAQRQ